MEIVNHIYKIPSTSTATIGLVFDWYLGYSSLAKLTHGNYHYKQKPISTGLGIDSCQSFLARMERDTKEDYLLIPMLESYDLA